MKLKYNEYRKFNDDMEDYFKSYPKKIAHQKCYEKILNSYKKDIIDISDTKLLFDDLTNLYYSYD